MTLADHRISSPPVGQGNCQPLTPKRDGKASSPFAKVEKHLFNLPPREFKVFGYLLLKAGAGAIVKAKVKTIAWGTDYKPRSVQYALASLKELGFIRERPSKASKSGREILIVERLDTRPAPNLPSSCQPASPQSASSPPPLPYSQGIPQASRSVPPPQRPNPTPAPHKPLGQAASPLAEAASPAPSLSPQSPQLQSPTQGFAGVQNAAPQLSRNPEVEGDRTEGFPSSEETQEALKAWLELAPCHPLHKLARRQLESHKPTLFKPN